MGLKNVRLRKLWLKVHLYIGLLAGAVLVLIGLTGSVLVFDHAIDELLNPALLTVEGEGGYRSFDEIIAAARAGHPDSPGPSLLVFPRVQNGVFLAFFEEASGGEYGRQEVAVDPYTAEILGERQWGGYLMSAIYKLHSNLLLETPGEVTVGILGLLLLVSVGTGIYLWWPLFWPPRRRKIGQAFTIRRGARPVRFYFDLHKTSGIYSAVIIVVIAFSGIYLVFPEYIKPLVDVFSPLTGFPEVKSTPLPGMAPISVEQAVTIADRLFRDAELKGIAPPEDPEGVYIVVKRQPGEVRQAWGESRVWIDAYSGEILAVRNPKQFSAGDTFLNWLFPLHSGEALGLPSRILVFISGFVPLILYVTGLKLWFKRRRSKKISRERRKFQ
ncbi:PepSY-associated TM helix domain-containing protein [Candidatus Manganitrophus noduliformans]|uniref:PepSY domain-containing protein n=1 Tax=Candidatus Manganitrophus noduliformans TaxID=2606439 RepID=A0A7X6IDG3_9BACT|nr:PepSY-associated TM helix domain-containing protein [Candidatus Manganitrophus noduliformans]NKE73551.1 PepSY domain-containing protein [Candidatus Manganitrophus noduliformans]